MSANEPITEPFNGPSFYLIKVSGGAEPHYVVCEPIVIIKASEGWAGLTSVELEKYITLHAVPAAPLPGQPMYQLARRTGAGHS